MAFTESEVIALLAQVFASSHPNLEVGIGDDAAVIRTTNRTVITTDMAVEGVHVRLEWSSPFEIGRKITAANLADVFSMGAKPTFLVVAVSLTGNEDLEWIEKLAKGIAFEANLVGATTKKVGFAPMLKTSAKFAAVIFRPISNGLDHSRRK